MDDHIYRTLRAAALNVLKPHLDALLAHDVPEAVEVRGGKATVLRREREQVIALRRARLPSEKERSAARLLAVVVKHRALVLWREWPFPNWPNQKIDDKSLPLRRLDRIQLESLENRTLVAVKRFAAQLPKREADRLVGLVTGTGFQVAVAAAMEEMEVARHAPESDAMLCIGWYDATMDAAHWFAMKAIGPEMAAMLLCRYNPNTETLAAAEHSTNDKTRPRHLVQLRQRFEDINRTDPSNRALVDWLRIARELELRYHSWIDQYVGDAGIPVAVSKPLTTAQAEPVTPTPPAPAAESPTVARQRQRAQELAILAKLTDLGVDAKAVPPAPAGKPSKAKQDVKAALGYSKDVMNKAWQRLRSAGDIRDAQP
ncbi:hypothetical protein Lcho_3471 [Leptothrix cholodnii SP-6]|uniref:Uncharacterized protein n=1 Tax=Leptothrix cholodnii (strain ATCC 51168 / LMG 8142 / SP-6) TaxID=395495 RepID=B1Y3M4_LEPCP|nr:hypothetical protein [Leptothrix cholodnii]ACB35727.1 hypothetical protein Lcho_3471 [Leptothrix cholodnii SP-6]